jgi:hypothetical protein
MLSWFFNNILLFQILGFIIAVVFFILTARLMIKMDYFSANAHYSFRTLRKNPSTRDLMDPYWNRVLKLITSKKDDDWKSAVKDADKIFDESLKSIGVKGKTIEERIQSVDQELTGSLDELTRLREEMLPLLEKSDEKITHNKAKEILRAYREVLQKMGMI